MQKQAPTLGRLLVMVGFALSCFGLLLFLWLAFGGPVPLTPKGYRFTTSLGEATQLAKEADVRISGVSVGKVKEIKTSTIGRSDAVIQIDAKYAPLAKDTKVVLRQKTLLGETYIELSPGNPRTAGAVPEDGRLPASRVSETVELDEIFRAFDPKTREAFRQWMQQQALAVDGRGQDISDALGNLAPFAEDTAVLLKILKSQQGDVRGLINNTGTVFDALSARDSELRSLIENSNRVFETTAARDEDLKAIFRILPTFERESTTTLNRLNRFARDTDPLVTQLRPAARELSPTLQQLSLLAPDAQALFRDLDPLIEESRRGLPALRRFLDDLRPFLGELDPPLRQLNPILDFIGRYKDELNAFFSNTVAVTQATDRPEKARGLVHYLRTANPFNPENLAVYPNRIGSNRPNPYAMPGAFRQSGKGPYYETRHCGNGNPDIAPGTGISPVRTPLDPLLAQIQRFAFSNLGRTIPAPPCNQQGKFEVSGRVTQYPQVVVAPSGNARKKK